MTTAAEKPAAVRRELANELLNMIAVPETGQRLNNLYWWLMGRVSADAEDVLNLGAHSLGKVLSLLTALEEEVR
jgi:hypothetical protein